MIASSSSSSANTRAGTRMPGYCTERDLPQELVHLARAKAQTSSTTLARYPRADRLELEPVIGDGFDERRRIATAALDLGFNRCTRSTRAGRPAAPRTHALGQEHELLEPCGQERRTVGPNRAHRPPLEAPAAVGSGRQRPVALARKTEQLGQRREARLPGRGPRSPLRSRARPPRCDRSTGTRFSGGRRPARSRRARGRDAAGASGPRARVRPAGRRESAVPACAPPRAARSGRAAPATTVVGTAISASRGSSAGSSRTSVRCSEVKARQLEGATRVRPAERR